MNLSNVKNHPQKNGFDLSYRNIMTANAGQLLPCMVKDVVPSDKLSINLSWFTRTAPLNTCAYTRIREHVDCFFVPYRLLWRYSDLLFTGVGSLQSAFTFDATQNAIANGPAVCPPLFYPHTVRKFCAAQKTIPSDLNPLLLTDDGGLNRNLGIVKLLDALGYGDFSFLLDTTKKYPNIYLNAFRLLAYQKIYSDFYRNEQWEDAKPTCFNVDYLAPSAYPSDVFSPLVTTITSKALTTSNYDDYNNSVFSLRYANYPKDLFTGVLPSPQYAGTSYAPVNIWSDNPNLTFTASSTSDGSQQLVLKDNIVSVSGGIEAEREITLKDVFSSDSLNKIFGNLSILDLRKAQALQRWKEITNCHKKSYKSQLEAHFDVDVSNDRSDMVHYLGGNVQTLNINEVVNTNLVDSNPNIGGTGVGSGNATINFTAPEHGIVMAIYYAEPFLDYSSSCIDAFNLKAATEDYFIPEFDKLGMQPLSIYNFTSDKDVADSYTSFNKHEFLGYVPRYAEYKTSVDRVSISAKSAYAAWVCPLDARTLLTSGLNLLGKSLEYRTTYQMFKVRPYQLNPIFKGQLSSSTSDFLSDQLLINFNNAIKAIRPMDVNGLPY